jgi:hypothetical protein
MKKIVLITLVIFSSGLLALEIDEKLTLRIVKTSVSKKTILVNRGIEDGLIKGDHAKFFVSAGVIGRGVCIKLSPTRSVWSVYRVVNADFLRDEQVLKLKITPAVKITKDDSRMLVSDDVPNVTKDPRDLGIPLAEGAEDLPLNATGSQRQMTEWDNQNISLLSKNLEVFGLFSYSSAREKTSPNNTGDDYTQDVSSFMLRTGLEWYFANENLWYHRFSFIGTFEINRNGVMSHAGAFVKEESSLFGIGANMYPLTMPSKTYSIIPYLQYLLQFGSTNSTYKSGNENQGAATDTLDGSIISHNFGAGFKFYTARGYGARLIFAYEMRGDQYGNDSLDVSWLKTRVGPKVQFGMSYRF